MAFSQFHSGAGTVDSADFLPLLRRLDDCIAYVAANPQASHGVWCLGPWEMGILR